LLTSNRASHGCLRRSKSLSFRFSISAVMFANAEDVQAHLIGKLNLFE
jgi:hypothetical protein